MTPLGAAMVGAVAGGLLGAGAGYIIASKNSGTQGVRAGVVLATIGASVSAIGGLVLLFEQKRDAHAAAKAQPVKA